MRAIAAWAMLRRRGVPAEVRIGARRGGPGIEAHAWLRCGDQEFFTGAGGEYSVLR